ncbi:pentatricopeptide repeat (PPR-like) superfamily protein, partial [Striga asiatica]
SKLGQIDYAHQLFDEFPNRHVFRWKGESYLPSQRSMPPTKLTILLLFDCPLGKSLTTTTILCCGHERRRITESSRGSWILAYRVFVLVKYLNPPVDFFGVQELVDRHTCPPD